MNLIFYIPMYNSSSTIKELIDRLFSLELPIKKVIIVDDGSTDESVMIVEEMLEQYPELELLKHTHEGVVNALMIGMSKVLEYIDDESYIVRMDSDLEHQPEDLINLIEPFILDNKCKCTVGYIPYDKRHGIFITWLNNHLGPTLYNKYCNLNIPQFCSGYYIVEGSLFKKLEHYFRLIIKNDMIYLDFLAIHFCSFYGNPKVVMLSKIQDKYVKKMSLTKKLKYILVWRALVDYINNTRDV